VCLCAVKNKHKNSSCLFDIQWVTKRLSRRWTNQSKENLPYYDTIVMKRFKLQWRHTNSIIMRWLRRSNGASSGCYQEPKLLKISPIDTGADFQALSSLPVSKTLPGFNFKTITNDECIKKARPFSHRRKYVSLLINGSVFCLFIIICYNWPQTKRRMLQPRVVLFTLRVRTRITRKESPSMNFFNKRIKVGPFND